MIRFTAVAGVLLSCGVVNASDLDECDFRKEKGACSATFSINSETHYYTIPSDRSCRTVTVQIDGTQYPHRQKDRDIVDAVMVFDKTKKYDFKVSGCTRHPTRAEVFENCLSQIRAADQQCLSMANDLVRKCTIPEKQNTVEMGCWLDGLPAFKACAEAAVDRMNACVGANVFRVDQPSPGVVNAVRTGEYLPPK